MLQKGFFVVEVVHLHSEFPFNPHLQLQLQLQLLLIKSILFETSVPNPLHKLPSASTPNIGMSIEMGTKDFFQFHKYTF